MDYEKFLNLANQFFSQLQLLRYDVKRNSGYLARVEIESIKSKISNNPKRLEQFGYKVYSQNDEDGIISEIFNRLGILKGTFLEIGVENGLECNTLLLLLKGWKGGWIECSKDQCESIRNTFKIPIEKKRLLLIEQFATSDNINQHLIFFLESIDEKYLDFLSIDIDGMDIYILKHLKIKPKVICIEYNSKFPVGMNLVPAYQENHAWDGSDFMGSSLDAIVQVANEIGYVLVGTNITGVNAFFVQKDLAIDKFATTESTVNLYNPPRYYLNKDYYSNDIGHRPSFGQYVEE